MDAKEFKSKTLSIVHVFVQHWRKHVREGFQPLLSGYESGLETGDIEWASWCAFAFCYYSYCAGRELTSLESEMEMYSQIIRKLKQETPYNHLSPYRQAVINLVHAAPNPTSLVGAAYNEEVMLSLHHEANDISAIYHFHLNKLILCYLFGEYHQAIEHSNLAENYLAGVPGLLVIPVLRFYDSLARLAVYHNLAGAEQNLLLEKVRANQEKLDNWANYAPMNHLHKYYLVEAEINRVLGDKALAIENYDRAVELALRNQYLNEESLAHELTAKFYLEWGKQEVAQSYLIQSYYSYARWGAAAKVENLETNYFQLLAPVIQQEKPSFNPKDTISTLNTITKTSSASSSTTANFLDFGSILKISQTLSSEIEQEKLLSKLMEVVMENAGAKKAALILPQNDTWLIEAYTTTESETKVMQSLPLNQYQDIAVAPIYYVIHAQERLVLDYAISSTSFASDSYIIQVQPQSLLVNPIFNQGKLIGILYLENHSTPGVFTQDRLEILNLICTQVAISLSNARLYTLEQEKSQQLYEKAQLLSFRTAIDSTLTQSEILTEMLQQCCQEIVNYLDAAFARIWTLNTQENVLELEASAGMYTHTNGGHSRIPVGKYKIGLIAQERLPHLTNNVQTDPRIGDREWAKREGMVGFAGYPLIIGGQLVGVLAVFTRHQIADNVLETLAFIARQIALGIKRKRNEAEINQKSIELSQALQDLQLAQLQLVQNEKMSALGNLVAGVAHEINNPVGFISGNILPAYEGVQDLFNLIDLYQENFPNPGSVIESEIETIDLEYLRADLPKLIYSMKEGVQRIRDISNSLRTFSRADTDYKVSFNIHDGLDSTILILKHRLKANENRPAIEIIKNYGNLPLIECFPGQLNQVFMNLLANAIDALEESNTGRSFAEIKDNPNCITITTKLTDDSKVNISIQDNGVGMSEEVKQKIFDHLYTTKIVGKGTGLGLAIVQQIIIDKHGGSIDVNSILGEGAEFLITIPLR